MRTDEENIALRAPYSAYYRSERYRLQELLKVPLKREVYHRMARTALKSGDPTQIARALQDLQQEVDRVAACQAKVAAQMPLLLDNLHPQHKLVEALASKKAA